MSNEFTFTIKVTVVTDADHPADIKDAVSNAVWHSLDEPIGEESAGARITSLEWLA